MPDQSQKNIPENLNLSECNFYRTPSEKKSLHFVKLNQME